MNPSILPEKYRRPHVKHFTTSSNEVFLAHLINRSIEIQFFPRCFLITRVIGSPLPQKGILIGWDTLTKIQKLRLLPEGVRFKQFFQSYVQVPRLFMTQPIEHILTQLRERACADSTRNFSRNAHSLCGRMSNSMCASHSRKTRTLIQQRLN